MAFLITSVKGLSGAFFLGDRSLLTSVVFLLQVLEILSDYHRITLIQSTKYIISLPQEKKKPIKNMWKDY